MDVRNYFGCYSGYFWHWEDDGEVLAIPGGNTIAYREHIVHILDMMVPFGIPSFGALLLAIIATNSSAKNDIQDVKDRMIEHDTNPDIILEPAIAFLQTLSSLPIAYKQGMKRAMIFRTIFDGCHNSIGSKSAKMLHSYVESSSIHIKELVNDDSFSDNIYRKDFRTIALLNDKFKTVDDILQAVAGLDEFEKTIELPEAETEEIKNDGSFIDGLLNNEKTFYIGALIKRLWSGLNIPFHTSLPSKRPMGGFSDITNKGDFDRLLISEFANDDMVLLSRLANNEALYLEREKPPTNDIMQRKVLIDLSLKNWGTPKTLAYAIAIALSEHPKNKMKCEAYGLGRHSISISLDGVDNVISSLQLIYDSIHAAKGLEHFFKENPKHEAQDIFFITEATTLKEPEVLKVLNDHNRINYLVLTNSNGTLDIYKKQHNSRKHIQHMELPLHELWQKKPTHAPKKTNDTNYPLLIKTPTKYQDILNIGEELFLITKDHMLLRMYERKMYNRSNAWEIMHRSIPYGVTYTLGKTSSKEYVLLSYHNQDKTFTILNITTQKSISFMFGSEEVGILPTQPYFYNDHFYFKTHYSAYSISLEGNICEIEREVHKKHFSECYTSPEELAKRLTAGKAPFRNITDIYINSNDDLVFNIHELSVQNDGSLTLKPKLNTSLTNNKETIQATLEYDTFTFPDGSTITNTKAGILVLRSSESTIPTIYISAYVNASLAAATQDFFAGNIFYNKQLPVKPIKTFYNSYIYQFIQTTKTRSSL